MPKLGHEDDDNDNAENPYESTDENVEVAADKHEEPISNVVEEDERLADADAGDDDSENSSAGGDNDQGSRQGRESAKARRDRSKRAKERDKEELAILRATTAKQDERLRTLERDLTVTRVTDLDNRLATALNEAQTFDSIHGKAITAKNGDDAVEAQRLANEARWRAQQIKQERDALAQGVQRMDQQPRVAPYANKAKAFIESIPWYNPSSGDEDSLVVEALDKSLMRTMDPNDPTYWSTLDKKVREKVPHRFRQESREDDAADDDVEPSRTGRRGPPTGGSTKTSNGRGTAPNEIRLPKEMVEAMKEAGQWDNPKVRERVAKRYIDGIKQQRG